MALFGSSRRGKGNKGDKGDAADQSDKGDAADKSDKGQSGDRSAGAASGADAPGARSGPLQAGLTRTRTSFAESLGNLILGKRVIDEAALDDLETALIVADVGTATVAGVMDGLRSRVARRQLNNVEALFTALGDQLTELLAANAKPFEVRPADPFVVMFVGINGAGKTTTLGKLAAQLSAAGHKVLMAAGDTFRAAAVEQLEGWSERAGVPLVSQGSGADSASVLHDAVASARSRNIDIVLADTAGRLHSRTNLMEELRKVRRVISRFDPEAPHEVLLVLDATTGQNALNQAQEFMEVVGVTGLVITKLDGTARGGMAIAVAQQTGLPIYFVGVGEQIDDLRPFEPRAFVDALLSRDPVLAGGDQ